MRISAYSLADGDHRGIHKTKGRIGTEQLDEQLIQRRCCPMTVIDECAVVGYMGKIFVMIQDEPAIYIFQGFLAHGQQVPNQNRDEFAFAQYRWPSSVGSGYLGDRFIYQDIDICDMV